MTALVTPTRTADRSTRVLVNAGIVAGPLFWLSSTVQMATRPGFDLARHPISALSNGSLGWVHIATFVLTGLCEIALAVALSRTSAGRRVVPVLVGIFGAGIVAAGVFTMDPENGFPLGVPDGPAIDASWHSLAHAIAAAGAFTALAVAALVVAVRHWRRKEFRTAAGSAGAALVMLAPMSPDHMSIQLAVVGFVGFTWTTVVGLSLRNRIVRSDYR